MIVSLKFITYIHTLTDPRHQRGKGRELEGLVKHRVHRRGNFFADDLQDVHWLEALDQIGRELEVDAGRRVDLGSLHHFV